MSLLEDLALDGCDCQEAAAVLADHLLESGWYDGRAARLIVGWTWPATKATKLRRDRWRRTLKRPGLSLARAVAAVLIFGGWEEEPWPCWRPDPWPPNPLYDIIRRGDLLRLTDSDFLREPVEFESPVVGYGSLYVQHPGMNVVIPIDDDEPARPDADEEGARAALRAKVTPVPPERLHGSTTGSGSRPRAKRSRPRPPAR